MSENEEETEAGEAPETEGPETAPEAAAEGDPGETPAPGEPSIMEALERAQAEAAENHDRYLRAVADLENYRKRMIREREEIRRYGAAALVEELLPALDNLSLGLAAAENHPEAKPVADGFALVVNQIVAALESCGVVAVDPAGERFDPNLHDCVAHEPSDEVPADHVTSVTRRGYRLHDRLLRPAGVVVSSGAATGAEAAPDGEKDTAGAAGNAPAAPGAAADES